MKLLVKCPCGCGHTFEVEVPKGKKNFTPEERARRSERMRAMGGRPVGAKGKKRDVDTVVVDSDQERLRSFMGQFDVTHHGGTPETEAGRSTRAFVDMVRDGVDDPEKCPFRESCDRMHIDLDGTLHECKSMQKCYLEWLKYLHPLKRETDKEQQ